MSEVCELALRVMVEALLANAMFAPATSETLPVLALTLNAAPAAGAEMVIDPAPAPTLIAPAPEITKALL